MKLELREYPPPDNESDTAEQKAAEESRRDVCE
jgi:hypothetical protein